MLLPGVGLLRDRRTMAIRQMCQQCSVLRGLFDWMPKEQGNKGTALEKCFPSDSISLFTFNCLHLLQFYSLIFLDLLHPASNTKQHRQRCCGSLPETLFFQQLQNNVENAPERAATGLAMLQVKRLTGRVIRLLLKPPFQLSHFGEWGWGSYWHRHTHWWQLFPSLFRQP